MWINGGVFWRLSKRFNIGVDARWSGGEVELGNNLTGKRKVEAGGGYLGLLLGFGFGKQSP